MASSLNWDDLSDTPPALPPAPSDSADPDAEAIIAKMNAAVAAGKSEDQILADGVADFGRKGREATAQTDTKPSKSKDLSWDDLSFVQPHPMDSDITAQKVGYPQFENYAGDVYNSPNAALAAPDTMRAQTLAERFKAHPLDTTGDYLSSLGSATVGGLRQSVAGIERMAGEAPTTVGNAVNALGSDLEKTYGFGDGAAQEPTTPPDNELTRIGTEQYAKGAAEQDQASGNLIQPPQEGDSFVSKVPFYLQSTAESAPQLAAGPATFAGLAAGRTYGEQRARGVAPGQSLEDAGIDAVANYATTKLMLDAAAGKEAMTGVAGMAKATGAGATSNLALEAAKIWREKYVDGQDISAEDVKQRLLDATQSGTVMGATIHTATAPFRSTDHAAEAQRLADQTAINEGADIAQKAGDATGMSDAIDSAKAAADAAPHEESANATETGQESENDRQEHSGDAQGGVSAEARGGGSDAAGREETPQVAPQLAPRAPQVDEDAAHAYAAARAEALGNGKGPLTDAEREEWQFLESRPDASQIAQAYGLKPKESSNVDTNTVGSSSEAAGSEEAQAAPESLHPDERNVQKAHALAESIEGLSDEQKAAIVAGYPKPAKDPLTGYDTRPELVPTIAAAASHAAAGTPAFYAEVDFRGLHPLNEHMGGQAPADVHMKQVVDGFARAELEAAGAEVAPNKKGGDEFGFTGTGIDAATAHDALVRAQQKAVEYLKAQGVGRVFNNRTGEHVETGIHFAATDIRPSDTAESVLGATDAALARRKRGAPYERPGTDQTVGTGRGAGGRLAGSPETAGVEDSGGTGSARDTAPAETSRAEANQGVTEPEARATLEQAFGKAATRKLEAAGLKLTSGEALGNLAPELSPRQRAGVKGLTTGKGEPHVIHDQTPAADLPGVAVHEVWHANADRVLSPGQQAGIARRVEKLAERSPAVREALDKIPEGERTDGEKVAYALQHLQNQSLGRRVMDSIKLGLNRLGVPLDWLNAHEAAVREIGQQNLRHFAEGEQTYQTGANGARFSRSYENAPDSLMGYKRGGPQTSYSESNYKFHQPVRVKLEDGTEFVDGMNGLNQSHAIERAHRNWTNATSIEPVSKAEYERANGEPYPVEFDEGQKLGGRDKATQFSREEPKEPGNQYSAVVGPQFNPAAARAALARGSTGNTPPAGRAPAAAAPNAPQAPRTPAQAASMVHMGDERAVREAGRGAVREALARRDLATAQADAGLDYFRRQYDRRQRDVITDPRRALQPIIDYQQGGLTAITDPLTQNFMREAQRAIDQRTTKIQAIGQREGKPLLQTLRENYFPQLWEQNQKSLGWAQDYYRKSPMQGDRSFLKQRVFDDIEQGLNAGYKPVSTNPVDLVMAKLWQMDKFIATHDMMHEMDDMGLLRDHPMDKAPPVGWGRVNDYTFTGKIVPESVAKSLNNILDPGLNKYGWWRSARYAENAILSARMGLSAFHAGFTTFDTLVAHVADGLDRIARGDVTGAIKSIAKSAISPLASPLEGRKLLAQVLGKLPADPQTRAVLDTLVSGGMRTRMDPTDYNNAYARFGRAMRQRDIGGLAKTAVPAVLEASTRYIMNSLVPYQKMSARVLMMKNELERAAGLMGSNPKDYAGTAQAMNPVALRDMAGRVNQLVDDRLGQVSYDNRFWNSTAKHIAQALVQAPGWNIGTLNVVGGPIKDVLRTVKPEGYAGPLNRAGTLTATRQRLTPRVTYLASVIGVTALYGAMRQYLTTGQSPESFQDLMMPRTGGDNPDGSPIREALPSYVKDMMELYRHPITTAEHKLNPVVSMGAELLHNKDYFGNEIRNPHDSALRQAGQLMAYLAKENMPYSVQNTLKARDSGKPLSDQLLPLVGVTQAPASATRSKFQEAVAEGLGGSKFSRTPEQADQANKIYNAENRLRMGQNPDLSGFDDKTRRKIEHAVQEPMMGQRLKRLVGENKQAALDAWEASTPLEREKFKLRSAMFPKSGGFGKGWNTYLESLDEDEKESARDRLTKAYEWSATQP